MKLSRRGALGALAAGTVRGAAQQPPPQQAPPRKRPTICLFSKHLSKLWYTDLGPTLRQLGFEGCDLTVRPGGHVEPSKANVDLVRALESIRGEGVDVPMITTALTTAADPSARPVLAIAGGSGVTYFKPGYWHYTAGESVDARLTVVRSQLYGLMLLGRAYGMVCGFHNHSGNYVGEAVWDTRILLQGMDPAWIGYYFDPGHATAEGGNQGWEIALRMVLPRLKMVALKDFYWEKSGGQWQMRWCPMGQGMVDWAKVFSMLAAARFTGPLSLHLEYNPTDELDAIARDLAFVKKQVDTGYANAT